ncbi:hypothetical protein [Methylovulum psychrotolerans]|nr:hypothetical protein [Methylovulum psychrotolerans]
MKQLGEWLLVVFFLTVLSQCGRLVPFPPREGYTSVLQVSPI